MSFTPRTVLVTGGGSGIGASLAVALHHRGCRVIIAGPTHDKLAALAATCPGMLYQLLDVADADAVSRCAAALAERFTDLDAVINSAGIQRLVDFTTLDHGLSELSREVEVNLTGTLNVAAAFLPYLRQRRSTSLVLVGSALGYVPLVDAPVYSATKAAVHSLAVSLRRQLREQPVAIVEVIPPVVQTSLHRGQLRQPPRAMSLEVFTAATLRGLDAGHDEIHVGLARVLRYGSRVAPRLFLRIVNTSQR